MSLATDLTACQARIVEAERAASAGLRRCRAAIPPVVYNELQLQLCIIASEGEKFRVGLGALRMIGELDQIPPETTAQSLELAGYVMPKPTWKLVSMYPEHGIELPPVNEVWKIAAAGDDVKPNDRNVLVESGEGVERA